MSEEIYDPEKEIGDFCIKNKINFTNMNEFQNIKSVGLLPLAHDRLQKFIQQKKTNGFYILNFTNPDNKAIYGFQISYEGGLTEAESKKEVEENLMRILKDPNLFFLIIKELSKKIEGEEESKKAITLSLCGIWDESSEVPLNSLVSSESSTGKSFICKNIVKLFPQELVQYRTKITPEAFTYWKNGEDWDWNGKICYLEDISQSILDSPTFKVMCSEGSMATIVIKQKAVDIEIKGKPVMLVTTARTNPNIEILNRFQIISLDESKEQTRAIVYRLSKQKNTPYNFEITKALSKLKRKSVYIPYAEKIAKFLDENYNFESIRLRRDFSRLLSLIKCSAVLHQFQRESNEDGEIIANEQDYSIAREVINYIATATFKGLTHRLKKAYACCQELKEFTAKEIHSKFPFVNQKTWYNYLDQLLELKMLSSSLKSHEEVKQPVTHFSVNKEQIFELPEFSILPEFITKETIDTKVTKVTIDTKVTKVTKVTNDSEKNGSFVTNVSNVVKILKSKEDDIDFYELDKELDDG